MLGRAVAAEVVVDSVVTAVFRLPDRPVLLVPLDRLAVMDILDRLETQAKMLLHPPLRP